MNPAPLLVVMGIVVVIGLIVLAVLAAQARAERERQRKLGLARWAERNGFRYDETDPWDLDARYHGIGDIGKGHDRYAFEVLRREDPAPTTIFQYHYTTWETRTVTDRHADGSTTTRTESYEEDHWRRYLIVELNAPFPALSLRGESWLDRVAGFVGFDDIDFESEEFSKAYFCKSNDRQFAYAVIHPQMMEWLMTQSFAAEVRDGLFVMPTDRISHTAEGCRQVYSMAAGFINRIPVFVWQDYGKRPPITFHEPADAAASDPVEHAPL